MEKLSYISDYVFTPEETESLLSMQENDYDNNFSDTNYNSNVEYSRILTNLDVANKDTEEFNKIMIKSNWSVFLMYNSNKRKVKTHTILGITDFTYEELLEWFNDKKKNTYNQLHNSIGYWIPFLYVYNFDNWETVVTFFKIWRNKTRGILNRYYKGVTMIEKYTSNKLQLKYKSVNIGRKDAIEFIKMMNENKEKNKSKNILKSKKRKRNKYANSSNKKIKI